MGSIEWFWFSSHLNLQCELDIMFHLEKAHFMLEEMVMNGCIVETSKSNILAPIQLMDKTYWKDARLGARLPRVVSSFLAAGLR